MTQVRGFLSKAAPNTYITEIVIMKGESSSSLR